MPITLSENKKLKNESQWPKTYTRKFLEPGMVDYTDMGMGILYLGKETIDLMIPSFIDKPVVIKHQEVTPGNFQDIAVGYIKSIYFNPQDLWYYVDYLITKDEGHEKMEAGWGVSCAYKVGRLGNGGKRNNVDYEGEIIHGEGEHLALVQNPRYEQCLMIVNGKEGILYNEISFSNRTLKNQTEDNEMRFNFFGKKDDKGFKGDTMVDLGNGKKATLADVIAFNNSLQDKHEIDGSEEVTLANGTKIKLEDAVKNFVAQNKATDDGEESDEDKAKKKAEGDKKAENAKKFSNCGCGGKDDKHMDNCKMYNSDGSEKEGEPDEKADKMENELKALKIENEALRVAIENKDTFIAINSARDKNESDLLLENGTKESGSLEDKLENGKKFFVKKA